MMTEVITTNVFFENCDSGCHPIRCFSFMTMKNPFEDRLVLLVVLGLVVIGIIILAAGFPAMELQTGQILFETPPAEYAPTSAPQVVESEPPPRGGPNLVIIVVGLVFLSFVLFLAYRYPQIRYGVLGISVWTAVLLSLIYLYNRFGRPPEDQAGDITVFDVPERVFANIPEETPAWFDSVSMVITLFMFLAVAGVILWAWRRSRDVEKPALEAVSRDAEAALADLRAGANLQDTIMRCYYDMNRSLAQNLGLRRSEGMTPREFEEEMMQEGLPREEVQQLTRLFEKVRYGAQMTDTTDQEEAIACLEAIVASVGQLEEVGGRS